MAREIDPKTRRIHRLVYAAIVVALLAGIGIMLNSQTEMLGGTIGVDELAKHVGQDPYHFLIFDIRPPAEFHAGHIPFSTNVPLDQLGRREGELASGKDHTGHVGRPGRAERLEADE